jgi:NitT/TauT family transport system substrate-binding protein
MLTLINLGEKMFSKYVYKSILFLVVLGLLMAGCAQSPVQTDTPATTEQPVKPTTIKIATLLILDNLPMYIADQEGIFARHNLKVEFIPAASAAERDQIIIAEQADGMINELVSATLYNKDQVQIQVVRFARRATTEYAQYHILVSANSGITDVTGLKGVEIGISQGTVIEYITDRLLQAEGLASEDIKVIAVPKMPDRMSLLASGELKAATLPDPLSFLAEQQGARILLDDRKHPEYGYSVLSFRKEFIDQNPEAVRNFLAAVEEATAILNADPMKYSSLLSDKKLVPESIVGTYKVGTFPTASVPSQEQWDDVQAWAKENGLISTDLSYSDTVTSEYLP